MLPEQGSDDGIEKMHKNLDREIRAIIATLTSRLASLGRMQKGADHDQVELEDDQGVRIITLAGNNVGATTRGEIGEKDTTDHPSQDVAMAGEQEALRTYVNSNFQSINNSIMMGGSYTTNDPGVHMDIADYGEDKASSSSAPHLAMHDSLRGKKGKKKWFASSKGEQQTDDPSD